MIMPKNINKEVQQVKNGINLHIFLKNINNSEIISIFALVKRFGGKYPRAISSNPCKQIIHYMTADDLRNELGSLIWKTATNLVHGGKVSPVQFMDFMLGSLFYRFISEDVIDYCNNLMKEAGVPDPEYANMPDEMAENARELSM